MPISSLIFLDESGVNLSMSRSYGRVEGGKRLVFSQPYERGNKFSIIGAVSNKAVIAAI
ncbi:hypothetical protein BH10PSE19_BH10PSE19_01250 [soil metagenome]